MFNRPSTILGIVVALGIAAVIVLSTTTLGETIIGVVSITGTTTQNVTLQTGLSLDSSLVGHWTFDGEDMINNVADVSGTGNTGFLEDVTSTTTARGIIGQAYEFDGANTNINVGSDSSLDSMSEFTLAAWVKPRSAGESNVAYIIAKTGAGFANNWFLSICNSTPPQCDGNKFVFAKKYDTQHGFWRADTDTWVADTWYHVVATYVDGDTANDPTMYINGASQSLTEVSEPQGSTLNDDNLTVCIGNAVDGGAVTTCDVDRTFDGFLDDVRIYNRVLSAEEVSRLYEVGATTRIARTLDTGLALDSNLIAHWSFDGEDMISNVADISGQGNHGALQGQTSTTTDRGVFGQALSFDGSNDYVDVGNIGSVSVVSFWIKPDTVTSIDIIDIDGTDKIETDGSGNIVATSFPAATIYVNGSSDSATITAGGWNHVAIVDTTGVSATDFDIARIEGEGNFAGVLDDVRLYGRALSTVEVLRLYGLGASFASIATSPTTASLPKTFQATCWDDTGGSRSCSGTGEDGEIQYGVTSPTPRFTDNGDGTVTDNYTEIIWLKNADCFGGSQWQTALDNAAGLNSGECGLTDGSSAGDWSLPNTWQLSSLQDHEESAPGLPSGHPFTSVFNGTYWTSSTRVSLTDWAITFSMNNPHLDINDKDVATGRTWPMRLSGGEDEALVRLPKTGLTSCWDDTGGSRSCSGTGEDGENQFGFSCPSPRFTDNGDGTVTDNCTDLVWLKNAGCFTGKLWQTALNDAAGLNSGECGLTDGSSAGDWILPNFYQMTSLVNFQNQSPALPSSHPFTNVQVGCFTSTTLVPDKGNVWGFNFNNASFAVLDKDVNAGCAWPVKK